MNRRSFFGSLCGAALLALADGTRLGETALSLRTGGRSRSILLEIEGTGEWIRRWVSWDEWGRTTWHEVLVGTPGADAPHPDNYL